MSRPVITRIHAFAASLAFLTILAFWTSTVAVELLGGPAQIAAVKRAILAGLAILVPALALAGATGMRLGGKATGGLARAKKRRMPFIAANGLLILVPCAVILDRLASAGDFGALFVGLQALELAGGAVNLTLLGLNMRDGLRMTGRIRRPAREPGGTAAQRG
ncbi:hypothetical protein [Salinarimonas sp.]|uniref:hypothetical protein n=1 Tax=Salinarimonas sp. TaxID=2766526 RepID=UPI0032D99854